MKRKTEFKVINHRKNGEEISGAIVIPYEITKALIEAIGLSAFISSADREEASSHAT